MCVEHPTLERDRARSESIDLEAHLAAPVGTHPVEDRSSFGPSRDQHRATVGEPPGELTATRYQHRGSGNIHRVDAGSLAISTDEGQPTGREDRWRRRRR